MRVLCRALVFAAILMPAVVMPSRATTLRKLSLDDMIQQSTSIVRAQVSGSYSALRGKDVYTYYQLQVSETLKSASPASSAKTAEVAVPGGVAGEIQQIGVGSPVLNQGQEYVLFLWTSKSGMTQVIGLSQGLFSVSKTASGETMLVRSAADALVLDQSGNEVKDTGLTLSLNSLRARIQKSLAAAPVVTK